MATPEPANRASRRLSVVIVQDASQSLAIPHRSFALPSRCPRKQNDVAFPW